MIRVSGKFGAGALLGGEYIGGFSLGDFLTKASDMASKGKDMFSKGKDMFSKAKDVAKQYAPMASQGLDVAQGLADQFGLQKASGLLGKAQKGVGMARGFLGSGMMPNASQLRGQRIGLAWQRPAGYKGSGALLGGRRRR